MGGTTQRTSPGLILAATISAAMLVVANVSSLNVALLDLSRELGASQTQVHWMVDIYAVFLAALLLPAGAIGDRFGRRRILLFGLGVLVASNLVVLLMDSALPVILARGVSGIGAAFVFPATLSTITATMPDEKRARGVAMWTAAVSMGGIFGVLGSGLLIENYWWGSVFLGMAIASAAVLAFCARFVPDSSDASHSNLDPIGALLSFVAVGALVLGVVEGPAEGWTSFYSLAGLLVGFSALAAFVFWEWHNPKPLLDVRLFAERGIRSGSLSIFVQFMAAFGFFFVTVFYLQLVLGYGPLNTGLGLLPVSIGLLPASAAAIPLTRKFGRATMGVIGLGVLASAFVVGLAISVDSGFIWFAVVMVIFGLGLGLSSPPATEAIVEALPAEKQGVASALNDVLREFGAAIGIAVVGAAFNSGYRNGVNDFTDLPPDVIDAVRDSPAAAALVAPSLPDGGAGLLGQVSQATVDGWTQAMWVLVAIVVAGAIGYYIWAPRQGAPTGALAALDPQANDPALAPPGLIQLAEDPLVLAGTSSGPVEAIDLAVIHDRGTTATVATLKDAVAKVNERTASRLGVQLRVVADASSADVLVSLGDQTRDVLDQIGLNLGERDSGSRPDMLAFLDPTPVGAPLDGVAEQTSLTLDRLHALGARSYALPSERSTEAMAQVISARVDVWIDKRPHLATTPRLHLADMEIASPLGALEIAASAEADVRRLAGLYDHLLASIDSIDGRSTTPPDLHTWSASDQTIMAERAAIAMEAPMAELGDLSERALARVRDCDSLVAGALAELGRVGKPSFPLGDLDRSLIAVDQQAQRAEDVLSQVAGRLDDLATLRSTLRPTAERTRTSLSQCTQAHKITNSWVTDRAVNLDEPTHSTPLGRQAERSSGGDSWRPDGPE